MLRNALALQESNKYNCFYFIADYHAMTQKYDPKDLREQTISVTADLLATGINPKKSAIFIQSHVPEHANLAWIFNTITTVSQLERMVEYKEKLGDGQVPNTGLFDYPVLMAADILVYKSRRVPVGEDQRQHLELARDIARTFNGRFGETFKEPKAVLTRIPRVMSLNNPSKKMSKSIPSGCLYLQDSPKAIREKVMSAETDSMREIGYDPATRLGVSNLVLIYSEFSGDTPDEVVNKFTGKGYREFKESLADLIIEKLADFQEKRKKILKDKRAIIKILESGEKRVSPIAEKTMEEVRRKTGLI